MKQINQAVWDYAAQRRSRRNPLIPLAVVLLHVLLLWGIQVGMTQGFAKRVVAPVQAMLLEMAAPAPLPLTPAATPSPGKNLVAPAPPSAPAPVTPVATPLVVPLPAAATAITAAANTNVPALVAASPQPAPVAVAPVAAVAKPVERSAPVLASANCEKPEYPMVSRRRQEEGTVYLRFLIGADGQVRQSEVEKSSGSTRLDEAARAGLSKCKFKPASVDGTPVEGWANITYIWRLE